MKKLMIIGLIALLMVITPVAGYEYSIDYGSYFVTETGTGSSWWGPDYDVSPQYPLTDYEITYTPDWSSNTAGNYLGAVYLYGYSGSTPIFAVFMTDSNEASSTTSLQFRWLTPPVEMYAQPASPDYGNWSGSIKIVHRAPDIWEIWRDDVLLGSGTRAGVGPLTNLTLKILRNYDEPYPPGLSVGSVSIYGVTDVPPPTQPCMISVYDADSRLPLSGTWDYYVVVQGADDVSGSGSGAFTVVNLPVTSTLKPHLLYVTKEGYEMTPGVVAVEVPVGGRQINIYMTPNETVVNPGFRTGTVTMTDNNGTTITGFEVTAENAYTDQSYTVATDTDVAVISLPMDRTIEIRNPQTGVYEEAPVGYYRFYGQAPGYRMLNEDGIQISVMPEEYTSYQLCDIRVTQESGYLTGKHQFQIRSRSDNSILQTGTISAKSATTGEWYNTTVTDGIATLILPYDTSNVQSQYAGNYYVYATSPGYEDSDYGTQIVVMPHTVSEIRDILLTPIGGVPPAGNVTLRIQVFSETGQGVRDAEIFIAGVLGEGASLWDTYTASSTGYLTVSVPGNSTYDIVASGTGYYDSARRVQVFAEDPALIEIKLYLSGAPTPTVEPTTQPTGWITPPPTQTTPPIQEDNLIGLSVKGLAKGFGIDYDTALLMFGLMIIFGAGGMVMSSVKGGAMEFIAGSIVGTFVAFALGLIPIWIFIIIAVVFGAYVLRVFVQGSQ